MAIVPGKAGIWESVSYYIIHVDASAGTSLYVESGVSRAGVAPGDVSSRAIPLEEEISLSLSLFLTRSIERESRILLNLKTLA